MGVLSVKPKTKDCLNGKVHLELLISEKKISNKLLEISKKLDVDYQDKELMIVMIMKGALCLVADLIRHIQTRCSIEFVQGSSYGYQGVKRGELKVFGIDHLNIDGKNVLVVDDIFDSGITLNHVVSQLKEKRPKSIRSLVLLSKKVARKVNYIPDYILFEIEDQFVVGYGLDYKEYYRGLSGVYALETFEELK
jgi:hypoxanthine phosphoribosyltransferase